MDYERALRYFTKRRPDERKLAKALYLHKLSEVVVLRHYTTDLIEWHANGEVLVRVHDSKTSLKHLQAYLPPGYRIVGDTHVRILATPAGSFAAADGTLLFDAQGLPKDHQPWRPTDAGTLYREGYAYTSELVAAFYARRLLGPSCESCVAVGAGRWMSTRGLLLHIRERRKCLTIIEQALHTIGGVQRYRIEPFFSPKPPPPKRTRAEKDEAIIQRAQNALMGVEPERKVAHPCRKSLRGCVLGYLLNQFGFPKYFHNAPSRIWCP